MRKFLILLSLLALLLCAACSGQSASEAPEAPDGAASTLTFDQTLSSAKLNDLTCPVPLLHEESSETLSGVSKRTYTYDINGKAAALELRSSADPEAYLDYLPDNAQLRVINGTEWGVGAVVSGSTVSYNCRTVYEGRTYLVHAEEPENLYFFETQILPGLTLTSVE